MREMADTSFPLLNVTSHKNSGQKHVRTELHAVLFLTLRTLALLQVTAEQ